MSDRIQVKRDGEHRGWVSYVGVNVVAKPGDGKFDVIDLVWEDVWTAERPSPYPRELMPGERFLPMFITETFPSRDEAIRWLVEEETA